MIRLNNKGLCKSPCLIPDCIIMGSVILFHVMTWMGYIYLLGIRLYYAVYLGLLIEFCKVCWSNSLGQRRINILACSCTQLISLLVFYYTCCVDSNWVSLKPSCYSDNYITIIKFVYIINYRIFYFLNIILIEETL